jgi:hypothetical protein
MRTFIANPEPFLVRARTLQARVAANFTVDAMTREIVDFYRSTLATSA